MSESKKTLSNNCIEEDNFKRDGFLQKPFLSFKLVENTNQKSYCLGFVPALNEAREGSHFLEIPTFQIPLNRIELANIFGYSKENVINSLSGLHRDKVNAIQKMIAPFAIFPDKS